MLVGIVWLQSVKVQRRDPDARQRFGPHGITPITPR